MARATNDCPSIRSIALVVSPVGSCGKGTNEVQEIHVHPPTGPLIENVIRCLVCSVSRALMTDWCSGLIWNGICIVSDPLPPQVPRQWSGLPPRTTELKERRRILQICGRILCHCLRKFIVPVKIIQCHSSGDLTGGVVDSYEWWIDKENGLNSEWVTRNYYGLKWISCGNNRVNYYWSSYEKFQLWFMYLWCDNKEDSWRWPAMDTFLFIQA